MKRKQLLSLPVIPPESESAYPDIEKIKKTTLYGTKYIMKIRHYTYKAFWDQSNGKYYIMGCEVYFTGSLSKGVAYLGDYSYIVGNYSQDITVVKSEHSGLATNSVDYLGSCVFDSKAISGLGAFVKLVKKQS